MFGDWLAWTAVGFLLGCFTIVAGVLVFWINETSRYRRLYGRRDEHATDYERIGDAPPRT
jgi:hypothetical protein